MQLPLLKGIGFGLTSGVITTLGLIVGLHSFSGSKIVVVGGVLTIAVADSFSDALGIHISEESSENNNKHVWIATIATFVSKLIFSMTFLIPVLLLNLGAAILVSIIWGLLVLSFLSYFIARQKKEKSFKVVFEHLAIACVVIIITHYLGELISVLFV